ncbi:NAD-dependent epimerase/dehydratase family protein [Prochlorococcus marinus XMU1419]|uniref:NAD-dependent epimerase/dehydratase family protein n=1 Tax=Prochlorococcus marinus TaxID=1219 RepID=UPI001ADBEBA4|nr:NAD-dependent epimerase/dehydratase family protein [Prochlorococcus marinus]MBO8234243.1 NAD-dependent epimerase/dehydratase family protein [Prochlorococcus marinus XMU1419]MBW3075933.1 NAD-dependent dehydratase [Prochlorococcus marinus str. XMU1419]
MDITKKRFLVIGGGGLIGSHVVEALLKEEIEEVIIYDNFVRGRQENLVNSLRDKRCKVFKIGGDILQNDILDSAMEGIDGVFHLAALWLLQCHEFPKAAFDVNIQGTFNVIDSCRRNNIKKLIYSSSASVYGDALTEPMDEDHKFNNKNFYGATKICGEAMLRAYYHRYGLDYAGLRYMNVYGPRQDYKGAYIAVIMKMLDRIDNGESPIIYGDGSEAFDFVAVEDCGIANVCAMKSSATDSFYNVGTGKRTSLKQLAELILELTNSKKDIIYKERDQSTFVKNRIGCPKKAKAEINFDAKTELREGLEKLIKWRYDHKSELEARRSNI